MRATLRMILYLLAFVLGGCFLAYYIRPEYFANVVDYESGYRREARLLAAGLATILTLSPLSIMLRWLQLHRRAREISYSTESGKVSVNLVAVEEALTRALENEDCVKKAHVRVYEERGVKRQVIIESAMTFWEVPNVTERNRQCQAILRRRFAELMPEQTAVQVNLNVHRITPRREEKRPEPKAVPAAPPADSQPAVESNPFAGTPLEAEGSAYRRYPTPAQGYVEAPSPSSAPARADDGDGDDLYVGPSYPVEGDEDDSAEHDYLGKAIPVAGKKPKR
jgi:hypothetical protein